jgi:hypothetical protein
MTSIQWLSILTILLLVGLSGCITDDSQMGTDAVEVKSVTERPTTSSETRINSPSKTSSDETGAITPCPHYMPTRDSLTITNELNSSAKIELYVENVTTGSIIYRENITLSPSQSVIYHWEGFAEAERKMKRKTPAKNYLPSGRGTVKTSTNVSTSFAIQKIRSVNVRLESTKNGSVRWAKFGAIVDTATFPSCTD